MPNRRAVEPAAGAIGVVVGVMAGVVGGVVVISDQLPRKAGVTHGPAGPRSNKWDRTGSDEELVGGVTDVLARPGRSHRSEPNAKSRTVRL